MAVEFLDEAPAAGGVEWLDAPASPGVEFLSESTPVSPQELKQRFSDPNYIPSLAEFKIHHAAQESRGIGERAGDFLDTAGGAVAGVADMVVAGVKGLGKVITDPEQNDPLVTAAEGLARGVKYDAQLLGRIASNFTNRNTEAREESQAFLNRKLHAWRGGSLLLPGGQSAPVPPAETLQSWRAEFERDVLPGIQYRKFLTDRFERQAQAPPPGNISVITGEPAPFNPEVAEAASLVAAPSTLFPMSKALTPVKTLTRAAVARTLEGAGKTFEWVGEKTVAAAKLPERAAGAMARGITGTEEAAAKATETVAQGVAGVSTLPLKAAGKTITATGEATEAVGRSIGEGPSRYGTLERIAKDGQAPQWMRRAASAAQVIDPAISAAGIAAKGAMEGAAIGTVLGGVAEGEEGAAMGLGAGSAMGAGGALVGRTLAGKQYRAQLEDMDVARWIAAKTPAERANLAELNLSREQAVSLADVERLARGVRGPGETGDVEFRYVNDKEFSQLFGIGKGAQAVQGDRPVVFVNTGYKGGRSMFHETLHALDALEGFAPQRQQLNRVLFDQTLPDGQVVSKGIYSGADLAEFVSQYRSRLNEAARSEFDLLTPEDRQARIMSEVRSESFANLVNGYSGGASVLASRGIKRRVADALLLSEADSMLGKMRRALESVGVKFSASGDPSELFVRNDRPITNTPAVDAALRDYIRAKDNFTRKLVAGDEAEEPHLVVRPQDLLSKGNTGLVDTFKDHDIFAKNPDGTVKMMGGVPVLLSEREIKLVQSKRVDAMLDALARVPNLGEADTVKLKPNGAWEGRVFSDKQLAAFDALPDDVLSPAMKAKLRELNTLARQDGQQIILDYNAALKGGRYSSGIAPSTRAAVPLTFNISKAGNFYMATLDSTHFFRKLGQWRKSKPKAFDAWNGDVDAFLRDAFTYLDNHVNGRSGAVNLDSDPAAAVHKKNVINDFFNVPKGAGNEDLNPVQLSQRGDKDNLIRSRRFDRINRITPGAGDKFPIRYELQKANYLPVAKRGEAGSIIQRDLNPAQEVFQMRMFRGDPFNDGKSRSAVGTHWSNSEKYAEEYLRPSGFGKQYQGEILDRVVTFKRPLDLRHIDESTTTAELRKVLNDAGMPMDLEISNPTPGMELDKIDTLGKWLDSWGDPNEPLGDTFSVNSSITDLTAASLKKLGKWDGVLFKEHGVDDDITAIVFSDEAVSTTLDANAPIAGDAAGIKTPLETQSQRAEAQADKSNVAAWRSEEGSALTEAIKAPPSKPVNPNFLPAGVSPVAIHNQLRAQAEFDLAQKSPGPANLNQWLASAYLDVLDRKLNRGSTATRTAQLQQVKQLAEATTPQELSTAFAALVAGGHNGAKERLAAMAVWKMIQTEIARRGPGAE